MKTSCSFTKRAASVAAAIIALLTITSCEEIFSGGSIVDWAPVVFCIGAQDSEGTDLLDPSNPDNIINGTTITFKGETYTVSTDWYEAGRLHATPETKDYLALIYGLYLVDGKMTDTTNNSFALWFGEIDGGADMDEDLIITWGNGTTDTIHYHCSDHQEGRNPKCNRSYTLNGISLDSSNFAIIK